MTFVVFAAVILIIAFNILDIALAGMLGVSALIVFGYPHFDDILNVSNIRVNNGPSIRWDDCSTRTLRPSGILTR